MTILEAVKGRYSVRRYKNQPVNEKDLMTILESARWSQSAKNIQNWKYVVVRDKSVRQKLMTAAKGQQFVAEAPVVIVCCGLDPDYVMTCGQPAYSLDVAISMENMSLTAHELGLGTCWLGAFYEDEVKSVLGIPKTDVRVVGMLTLGYPGDSPNPKHRKSLNDIVCYEKWS
ncbi:NADH dehydrogenase [subsurface metagenome]